MSSLTNANPLMTGGLLDDFQPKPKPAATAPPDEVRADKLATRQVAQERGFVIDNLSAAVVRAKRSTSGKASKSHTLRLYIQDINRFQTWCNDNNYSQARGFELLLDKVLG